MTVADYKLTAPAAVASLEETYDKHTLREIAEHGCSSGVAHDHIYYQQTYDFFIQYEDDIEDYFHDTLGDSWMDELGFMNSTSVRGYINQLVWTFIEAIACQLTA